ncbi:MAG: low molecular weight phosphatase family protein [Drouetiella hepatica Uher 2000/2452]|jgi:protein-tyrosine phosphatase|uniref:Low molecular weight phosphatase family protein n=1 Tax=Drouetiella hepatica Uher 2000/2452 TaxID=904376 RepID=A0A951QDD4_9CYAN|nr:low molecular weight phosphatase family protein [Drouetiella hepatica Uher 2000/2452]
MKTILFLCTGNYYRSRFSEHWFNHLATQQNLDWRATSRGLGLHRENNNVGAVSPDVIAVLKERGVQVPDSLRNPTQVTDTDLRAADHIIAVDEPEHRPLVIAQFPEWVDTVEYWRVRDLDETTTESPLIQLERNIQKLVELLKLPDPQPQKAIE